MQKLHNSFEKPVENNSGGLLALLFRKSLQETKTLHKRQSLVENSVLENKLKYQTDDKSTNSLKHRIKNNVESPTLTWKTFVFLLTRILKVSNLKITIEFTAFNQDFIISQDVRVNTEEDLSVGLKGMDTKEEKTGGKIENNTK